MESGDFVDKLISFFEIWPLKNKFFGNLKKKSPKKNPVPNRHAAKDAKTELFPNQTLGGPRSRFWIVLSNYFVFVGLYEMKGFWEMGRSPITISLVPVIAAN
jgi:hypothetical protein